MSKLTKFTLVTLIISIVASALFLTGVVDVHTVPGLYVVFPLVAILYGCFLICLVLDKEVARFNADQHAHHGSDTPDLHPHNVEHLHDHDHHESVAA